MYKIILNIYYSVDQSYTSVEIFNLFSMQRKRTQNFITPL